MYPGRRFARKIAGEPKGETIRAVQEMTPMNPGLSDCMTEAGGVDMEGISEVEYREIALGSKERCLGDWARLQTVDLYLDAAGAVVHKQRCPKCKRPYINGALAPFLF